MSWLTVAEALELPAFQRANPVVVVGADLLDRPVRWAHATEQRDVVPLLRPGDLVLTMGTGLPDDSDADGLRRFAEDLAEAESSGLVVELGTRWRDAVPETLVVACRAQSVPLVVLTHETRFAALTQAIGERVVDAQLHELVEAQRVHDTFTELSFAQAGPADILDAVCRLTGGPVVLENAEHRPLDFLTGSAPSEGFLDNWQARSSRVTIARRTGWDEASGWLVTRLGSGERDWGRLVIASPARPSQRLVAVAERAAAALALHRLHDRDRDNVVRRVHHELINGLQADPDTPGLLERCEVAGFPVRRRLFLGLVARPPVGQGRQDTADVVSAFVRAAHGLRVPALVCEADREVRVLLSVPATSDPDAVADRLAGRVQGVTPLVVAAGRPSPALDGIATSLLEARQVADAVPTPRGGAATGPVVHRLADLHVRGLLALLGDDDRVRVFVDRELRRLREADAGRGTLVTALRAFLEYPASKTDAAASLHLSRAAFYDRLAKIQAVLGVDLDAPEVRLSLHLALLADEMSRQRS
jgi:purine catabolism regulator